MAAPARDSEAGAFREEVSGTTGAMRTGGEVWVHGRGGSSCGATAREVTHYLRDARLVGGSRVHVHSAWPRRGPRVNMDI